MARPMSTSLLYRFILVPGTRNVCTKDGVQLEKRDAATRYMYVTLPENC